MKVVILCGGKGQRMKEYTEKIPKPLVDIGGHPMLWHIMKTYKHYGFDDFVLLLGYMGKKFKDYFLNYKINNTNFKLDTTSGEIEYLMDPNDHFNITFVDTGLETMTGSRIKKAHNIIGDKRFMLTYGDGLSDIDINRLLDFHIEKGRVATVTGINKKSQYGTLITQDGIATAFEEKNNDIGIINGGFFVFEPEIFHYLKDGNDCVFESDPLENLASDGQLAVYMHTGFWTAADTYNDIAKLNKMCAENMDLWRVW